MTNSDASSLDGSWRVRWLVSVYCALVGVFPGISGWRSKVRGIMGEWDLVFSRLGLGEVADKCGSSSMLLVSVDMCRLNLAKSVDSGDAA